MRVAPYVEHFQDSSQIKNQLVYSSLDEYTCNVTQDLIRSGKQALKVGCRGC